MSDKRPTGAERALKNIKRGDIIQLSPHKETTNQSFAGCLAVVDEVKSWGVKCYVHALGAGIAYYRAIDGSFEHTGGKAVWTPAGLEDEAGHE